MVTLVPLSLGFGLEDALEQNGIFRDESSFLDLENLDQHSLLGELVFPGCQLLGNDLAIAGAPQLFAAISASPIARQSSPDLQKSRLNLTDGVS